MYICILQAVEDVEFDVENPKLRWKIGLFSNIVETLQRFSISQDVYQLLHTLHDLVTKNETYIE